MALCRGGKCKRQATGACLRLTLWEATHQQRTCRTHAFGSEATALVFTPEEKEYFREVSPLGDRTSVA